MAKVAFIGLGVMGYPMAGHLIKDGYDVTVYNRTAGLQVEEGVRRQGREDSAGGIKGQRFRLRVCRK